MDEKNDDKSLENDHLRGFRDPSSPVVESDPKPSYFIENQSVLNRAVVEPAPLATTPAQETTPLKSKSVLRMRYEAEVSVIRRKLGDLEQIRNQLGLSQRKMCQLLMVDPSAWTRWTRGGEAAPPHVYRMLQWYLAFEDKYPALDANFWLSAIAKVREPEETAEIKKEISTLKEETLLNAQRGSRTNAELMRSFESRMQSAERLAQRRLWWILAVALLGSLITGLLSASLLR